MSKPIRCPKCDKIFQDAKPEFCDWCLLPTKDYYTDPWAREQIEDLQLGVTQLMHESESQSTSYINPILCKVYVLLERARLYNSK